MKLIKEWTYSASRQVVTCFLSFVSIPLMRESQLWIYVRVREAVNEDIGEAAIVEAEGVKEGPC